MKPSETQNDNAVAQPSHAITLPLAMPPKAPVHWKKSALLASSFVTSHFSRWKSSQIHWSLLIFKTLGTGILGPSRLLLQGFQLAWLRVHLFSLTKRTVRFRQKAWLQALASPNHGITGPLQLQWGGQKAMPFVSPCNVLQRWWSYVKLMAISYPWAAHELNCFHLIPGKLWQSSPAFCRVSNGRLKPGHFDVTVGYTWALQNHPVLMCCGHAQVCTTATARLVLSGPSLAARFYEMIQGQLLDAFGNYCNQ